ncbi:MAG: WYL domain-containing protein [Ilumatobacter sp.]|uniref:helix-turn-helix transcriptional regulator n=1 Tax=Ilumatobacter sp. TaxID=1967498 RepID=UPI00260B98B7|nr:WYL domain-containing protein [Ilumatobacter sp.]MDJ0770823.1 WYL domain-containing protein [Ilumatobacter sp.]
MNRTDRLHALAAELRAAGSGGRTSTSLAEQFELSTRTIKRDITALQTAGVPIWSTPGPGGGYRLLEQRRPDVDLSLTAGEAAAIAVALRSQTHVPFATEASVALSKVLAVLDPHERAEVDDLLLRIWTLGGEARHPTAKVIDRAVRERRVVAIDYVDADGTSTSRRVDPLQLVEISGIWYLLAYCRLRAAGRWFRLDRVQAARITRQPADEHDVAEVIGQPPDEARSLA